MSEAAMESTGSEGVESESIGEEGFEGESTETTEGESTEEAISQLEEDLQEAKENGASKKELKQMVEEFELKVNGKTIKHKLDWNDKESIKAALQKSYAFNDVSNEYANVRKGLNTKIESWKSNPKSMFSDLGLDPKEYLNKWVQEEIEELELDPKDKLIKERDAKLKEYEDRERKAQEEREMSERERQDKEALDFLISEIDESLSNHEFLKPTEKLQRRMADMMASYSTKYPDITAKQVLPKVEAEIIEEFNELVDMIPEDKLEKLFRASSLEKIGKKVPKPAPKVVKKVPVATSQVAPPTAASAQQKQQASEETNKKRSFEDVFSSRR